MTFEQFAQGVARLAPLFQILASLGVLGGIVTAYLGFRRYRAEKQRDRKQQEAEYLSALRKSIFMSRPIFRELNRMLKSELFYEMALSISNSDPMNVVLDEAHSLSRKGYNNTSLDVHDGFTSSFWRSDDVSETLRKELQERLRYASFPEDPRDATRPSDQLTTGYLGIPVRTKLVELFEKYTNTVGTEIEPYRFDYPSLSRVLLSANYFFARLVGKYELYARDTDRWTSKIAYVATNSTFNASQEQGPPTPQPNSAEGAQGESSENSASAAATGTEQNPPDPTSQGAYAEIREKIKTNIQEEVQAIQSVAEFKDRVTQEVVYDWYYYKFLQDAEAIDAVLAIVEIVTRTYLSKKDEDLLAIHKEEQGLEFAPIEQTPRPEQLLAEAYDGLKPILSDYDRDSYHAYTQRIARTDD